MRLYTVGYFFVLLGMQFVNPLFLIALSSLAIPVIIHLFNFRRYKKIYFTNVRFLTEIQQETKQQSRLKQLLILLARLLAIACLVIAFAQPFIPSDKRLNRAPGQRVVSIYLDNSWSMDAVASDGKLLEIAKVKALEITSAYAPSDLFQLVTNDFEGRHQRFVSQEEFRKLIEEISLSPASRTLPEVISRQNDILTGSRNKNRDAYLISDFQRSSSSLAAIKPDTSINWLWVPVEAEKRDNLYIDSVWFASPVHQPGQPVKLTVRIRNSGAALEKVPVKVTVNKVQKAIASFSIGAGSLTDIVLPYTENETGMQSGIVTVTDYPVVYDDKYYFAYNILPSTNILCINEEGNNQYIQALFGEDSAFTLRNSTRRQLDYGAIGHYSLVILNSPSEVTSGLINELTRYVHAGGNLVIIPPEKGNLAGLNLLCSTLNCPVFSGIDTLRQKVASISLESDVFNDIFERNSQGKTILPDNADLPMVFRHYYCKPPADENIEVLMKLQDGQPLLTVSPAKKGKVYLFSVPLTISWSNFPQHLLFVPTFYKISLLSNLMPPLTYTVGREAAIGIPYDSLPENGVYKIQSTDSEFEIIPGSNSTGSGITLYPHDQIREAGFYIVKNGTRAITGLAYNYNRLESDLACYTARELENEIKRLPFASATILKEKSSTLTRQIRQLNQGTPLWKIFIVLALLFLATEILMIRTMKN